MISMGRGLVGVGPSLEIVPGNRRGRRYTDPDKRGFALIVRHGDTMIRHPSNTLWVVRRDVENRRGRVGFYATPIN